MISNMVWLTVWFVFLFICLESNVKCKNKDNVYTYINSIYNIKHEKRKKIKLKNYKHKQNIYLNSNPENGDNNETYEIKKFEPENIQVNKNLNINIFKNQEDDSNIYNEGMCIYNILKDIEIKDVKKVPSYDPELTNVKVEQSENGETKLVSDNSQNEKYLENSLIYSDKNYDIPNVLNYYPDDMFIFNFDGVINMNKQEKIVVAFITFIKLFKCQFLFNKKQISNLPLYKFITHDKTYLFNDYAKPNQTINNENDDLFILLKIIPKFFYTRLLYIFKYIKRNQDLVIAIKYIYDNINDICTKYNYDINQLISMSKSSNAIGSKLEKFMKNKSNNINTETNEHEPASEMEESEDLAYQLAKDLTNNTFNPNNIVKYKRIENLSNIFPSFRVEFENFYINNKYLELYKKYNIKYEQISTEFNKIRNLLINNENKAYTNLLKYRYPINNLNEQDKKYHETWNVTAIDIINNNINKYGKPIYIISTVEDSDFIKYTLNQFGVHIKDEKNNHLLRVYGKNSLNENKEDSGLVILRKLGKLIKSTNTQNVNNKNSQEQIDYIYDPYNMDINYYKYFKKTGKKNYYLNKNSDYNMILKNKCNLVYNIINTYHTNNMIHIIDDKYEDLNALNNDIRFNNKVKLYFCEWGYNTYNDKLKSILNDKIKTFSETFKLIFLCCTYQNSPRRKHTHGKGIPLDFYSKFMHKYCLKNNLVTEQPIDDL
ncbi:conserved Plasmodium protein, unknown function [Plasmodium vinckei vinckei]|uniref:Fam-a protein n=1 Tax=Plasmodium vinckei vinckei TaxID=54757 RepID=A0A081IB05_PLAVN|nr:conserved Plasmodium protein, unknown function [Plasmodium vinckei vinckei]KEG00863.1 hypothetical protein YYE_04309 [Plasmodium vinckei vinckei]VEV55722.1 conserved Plasmodium protein, unknown function [Plasmodium vinckei vinckei]